MTEQPRSFAANLNPVPVEPEIPKYEHGYSEPEVAKIVKAMEGIKKRDLQLQPVTLEEMKEVVVPFQRIHRTTVFNLNPEKPKKEPKERVAKEPKERKPRVKKLTAAEKKKKINEIVMKMATGQDLTPEEEEFFNANTTKV
ncbi:MAG: hypothetical protein WC967_13585 [Balneolaceae bacterium]